MFSEEEYCFDPSGMDYDEESDEVPPHIEFHAKQGWQFLDVTENVNIKDPELFLLKSAKLEITEIRKRTVEAFRKKFPNKSFHKVTPAQLAVIWLPVFIDMLYEIVNEDIAKTHYSKEVCVGFVLHEAMIIILWLQVSSFHYMLWQVQASRASSEWCFAG